jgi:hypothetical protein
MTAARAEMPRRRQHLTYCLTHYGRADRDPVGGANMKRPKKRVKKNRRTGHRTTTFCNSLKQLQLRDGT